LLKFNVLPSLVVISDNDGNPSRKQEKNASEGQTITSITNKEGILITSIGVWMKNYDRLKFIVNKCMIACYIVVHVICNSSSLSPL
jgi:hypothetical protein